MSTRTPHDGHRSTCPNCPDVDAWIEEQLANAPELSPETTRRIVRLMTQ